jgi:O-antigen/teichoic acid export membrane protein
MTEEQTSYRQIMKATSLFGGVQVLNIIIAIVRSKFIAVLLGPLGMGIAGLLNTTTNFVGSVTNFGLGVSAVRDVAAASSTNDEERIAKTVIIFRRLVWITGILGMVLVIILSPFLSQITFGNKDYTVAFILISVTLLIIQISSGQSVLLQGLRKLKYLANATILGSILGLITTVPLYYFFGINGIVPAIIIAALIALFSSWYYSRKIKIKTVKVTRKETIAEGKGMIKMGFMISLSGLISVGVAYVLRIYISNTGGVAQVGLYNAGFAIVNTYVGMVFTAMSKDYYPRLSAVAHSNDLSKQIINQQAEIAILILAPIILIFLVFINFVITLLYSDKFLAINDMIHWAAMGIIFQAASWAIAFVLLAKGASNLYFWNELIAAGYLLGLNILGYYLFGLTGLGISFLVSYIVYLIHMLVLSNIKYSFNFNKNFLIIFSVQLFLSGIAFILMKFIGGGYAYLAGSLVIIVSAIFSYSELDKRIGLKIILQNLLLRIRK